MLREAYIAYSESKKALSWPTTSAKITNCELITSYDSEDGDSYQVHATYKYSLNGMIYKNDNIAFGYGSSSSKNVHQNILDKLRKAETVQINYKSEDPRISVIAPGLNKSTITLFLFSITWLLFVLGFTIIWVVSSQTDNMLLDKIRIEQSF
jgi:hypothetical protein